jgi:hypothetical protein
MRIRLSDLRELRLSNMSHILYIDFVITKRP